MNTNKFTVLSNMAWRFAERIGAQGVSFVVSIVLARLLLPEQYGVVSLITIFTSLLNLFVDSGFNLALIQKKDADQLDFSTVFYFNVFMGFVFYLVMYIASPAISVFYDRPYMIPYIRVMSLTLILGGINGVQHSIVAKRMEFKRFFYSTLGGTLFSAFLGIYMAYRGYGVWAIIAQRLSNQLIDTIILCFTVRWRPSLEFSFPRLLPMFNYGYKILLSSVLNTFTSKFTNLLIGKIYSAEELAYFEKGDHIPSLFQSNLHTAVQSVLMPVLSEQQDSKERLKATLRRSIIVSSYIMFPCLIGLAVCSGPLIRVLYTEKWSAMIPYMQLICLSYLPWLIHTANLQVIKATGRSDIYLKIEVLKQVIGLVSILIAIQFSIKVLLFTYLADTVISFFINAYPNKDLADYGCLDQIKDFMPTLLLSIAMGAAVLLLEKTGLSDIPLLGVQICLGVFIYLAGSVLFKMEGYSYLINICKEVIHKWKSKSLS